MDVLDASHLFDVVRGKQRGVLAVVFAVLIIGSLVVGLAVLSAEDESLQFTGEGQPPSNDW